MTVWRVRGWTLAFTLPLGGCFGEPIGSIEALPRALSIAEQRLVAADNRFAFRLLREVNRTRPSEDLFLSPLSVGMALGMLYHGAEGQTRDEMGEALSFTDISLSEVNEGYRDLIDLLVNLDSRVTFSLANSVWARAGVAFDDAFLERNRMFFDAEISTLDFAAPDAARTINGWVRDKTSGRIEEIVDDPLPFDAVMYLINAIYFKGTWTYQFDPDRTAPAPFRRLDGSETPVNQMHLPDEAELRRVTNQVADILELPYGGRAFNMTIALPQGDRDVNDLIAELDHDKWQSWMAGLSARPVAVSLPRFTLEYEIDLPDALRALGMERAFVPALADFSATGVDGLYVSAVRHKTFVKVDEEGTEAAAVTSVDVRVTSARPVFHVDRPFLFVIRENLTGTIVFMGKIVLPVE